MPKHSENLNDSSLTLGLKRFSKKGSLVVALVGFIVILAWVFDIPLLKGILPNLPTMKVNTALCFLLGGTSLALWHWQGKREKDKGKRKFQILSLSLAFLIALIALLTLLEYGFNVNLGIDEFLIQQPEPMGSTAVRGRMAPNTALAFLFEGSALLLLSVNRPNYLAAQGMAVGGGLIGFVGLLGYVYGSVYFYTASSYTGMAVHTAIAFLLLASGILCARPDRGLMPLLCSDGAGSLMARRLLPFAIFVPLVVGGLSEMGYKSHLYTKEVEAALSTTLDIILFSGLAGWNAYKLNHLDSHRIRTQLARQQANEQLQQELRSRQQAEEALQVSQARLAGILEVANDAIISVDEHQRITLFNHGAEQIFGYSASEVLGQPLNLLTPTRFAAAHHQHVSNFGHSAGIARRMGERKEIFARRKDGTEFPVEASISKLDMGGEKLFTAFMRDITERKQAQEALVKLAAIVESSDDAIISKSLDGMILSWNAGAQRIFGYSANEAIGQSMSILIPPDRSDKEPQILQKIKQGERIEHYETVRRHKDGQLIDVSVSVSPIKDTAGKIVGASAIKRDITEGKRTEKALRLSEERLQLALEASNDGLWDWNIEAGEIYLSPRWIEMLGYEWDELPQESGTWETLIHPDDKPWVLDRLNAHLKDSSVSYAFDYRLQTKSGEWKWVADYGKVVARDKNGLALRMTGTHKDISDRKRAEEALKESEERWQLALRGNNDGIWDWNVKTNEVFFSARWKEMLGYEEHEIANHLDEWAKRVHPDDLDWVVQVIQDHFAKKTPFYISEHRVLCKDGTYKWILDRGQALWDEDGNVLRMTGSHTDISDRKRMELELRSVSERLQYLLTASPALIYSSKPDGDYGATFVSENAKDILGYEAGNFLDDSNFWVRHVHPDDADRILAELPRLIEQEHYSHEYRFLHADGTYRRLYDQMKVVKDETGKPIEIVGYLVDISDRFQAEEKLRHREAQLNTIISTTSDGIIILDRTGQVCFANPAAVQLFDTSLEELIGYDWGMPVGKTTELELVRCHGEIRTVEMRATPIEWLSKPAYIVALRDITERKQSELELQRAKEAAEVANQAKSIFLANMSHELRTPLNVILGFTQVMNRDSSLSPKQFQNLQIISKSGNHLLNLINDVLDLSKIEAGRITLDESSFDLIALVRSLQEMLRQRAIAKGLQFNLEIASNVPQYVSTDSNKLRQVLINLLGNAIKFTQKGSVTLRVVHSSEFMADSKEQPMNPQQSEINNEQSTINLLFEVSDTGVGIAPTELDTIFDAFVQTQAGRVSNEGTGLGLTITRKFVQLMGGEITIKSTLGQGSTFSFEIRVHLANAWEVPLTQTHYHAIGLAHGQPSYRILVADDQPENRLLLVKLLTQLRLEVREAKNGQEAVNLWQQWQPHLIWMDIRMPLMDGYVATQQIRSSVEGQSTIIIALTAQASNSDRTLALKVGCNDYVTKPFQEETLFAKMAEHLGLRYLYADSETINAASYHNDDQAQAASLTPESLCVMPPEWMNNLHKAAKLCDEEEILHLLEQIPSEHTSLIAGLSHFARDYQFQPIVQLTQSISFTTDT